MEAVGADTRDSRRFRTLLLAALLAGFLPACLGIVLLLRHQVAGIDFSPIWAGARAALSAPQKVYDFGYITGLQGWPLGPGRPRPFIYPPSALLLFSPLALAPYWAGYLTLMAATCGGYLWAGRRIGAPWWLALFPVVWLVVYAGQLTLLIAALALTALTLPKRPLLAGVLFGVAAAIKPQMLVFAPLALAAEGRWRSLLAAGFAGLALCAASLAVWGLAPWLQWLEAVRRFKDEVLFTNPGLVEDMITPYALLTRLGLPGALAYGLAPFAAGMVWVVFRTSRDPADRAIALFAGALLATPYAMQYEAALLAPAVAAYLARIEARPWLLYALAAGLFTAGMNAMIVPVVAALSLPLIAWHARRTAAAVPSPA